MVKMFIDTIMKKYSGYYCRVCSGFRPNEAFSGKGRRNHVCKRCSHLPKEDRELIEYENEIFNYMHQTRISEKNASRLRKLTVLPYERIVELAEIVLEVAEVKPYKKKRLKELARKRPDILQKLKDTGLIMAC